MQLWTMWLVQFVWKIPIENSGGNLLMKKLTCQGCLICQTESLTRVCYLVFLGGELYPRLLVYVLRLFCSLFCLTTVSEFNNCPTRCDLCSLLYFCRQLYMFRVLTPIIWSLYNCNYSFWYWLTGCTTIHSCCWVPTQQWERMVVDPVNQYQKL